MKTKRLWYLLICLIVGTQHGLAADLHITAILEGAYYPDLPIYVRFSVANTGTDPIWTHTVGRGSPWVRPEVIPSGANEPLELDNVYRVMWRDRVEMQPGATLTGRIDIARFLPETEKGTKELSPGEYRVSLCYHFGTNATDYVKSIPQVLVVRKPDQSLESVRRDSHKLRQAATASTNIVSASVVPTRAGATDPYSLASRVRYARWLTRRGRFCESLSFWNDLLPLGDTAVSDTIETKEEIAHCYIGLKQPEKAKSILREISSQSDSAFGLLQILEKPSAEGVPLVSNEMDAATWNDLK